MRERSRELGGEAGWRRGADLPNRSPTFSFYCRVLLLLFLIAVSQDVAAANPAMNDGDMSNMCYPTGICSNRSIDKVMEIPGISLPKHGFVDVGGSFLSPFAWWRIFELAAGLWDSSTHREVTSKFERIFRMILSFLMGTERCILQVLAS